MPGDHGAPAAGAYVIREPIEETIVPDPVETLASIKIGGEDRETLMPDMLESVFG